MSPERIFLRVEIGFFQLPFEVIEGLVDRITEMQEIDIRGRNGPPAGHGIEVENLLPVVGAEDDDGEGFGDLSGLNEGEDLHEFVERSEAAREDDQGLGEVNEPEFPHEEIMEFEVEFSGDEGIGILLVGNADIEPDGFAVRERGASIGGFHDPRAAAGADDEMTAVGCQGFRPEGQAFGEFHRLGVVGGHAAPGLGPLEFFLKGIRHGCLFSARFVLGLLEGVFRRLEPAARDLRALDSGRTEKNHGVFDMIIVKAVQGFHEFGQNAQGAGIRAMHEFEVCVRLGWTQAWFVGHHTSFIENRGAPEPTLGVLGCG